MPIWGTSGAHWVSWPRGWHAVVPAAAFAQSAPMKMVQQTPRYTVVLDIGPAEHMVSPMDAMHGQNGEVVVNSGMMSSDTAMMSGMMDQGMAANHHVEVHIALADSGAVVMDVTPTIRITDKSTGVARDLTAVMGMYGSAMGPADFHYGQNVFLPGWCVRGNRQRWRRRFSPVPRCRRDGQPDDGRSRG